MSPIRFCICTFISLWFGSVIPGSAQTDDPPSLPVRYSAVYIIHGDAGYLYHEPDGAAAHADQKVLREAIAVGERAVYGEVFIFHQRPERKIVGLFPKKDRRFLHYRNGHPVRSRSYSPVPDTSGNPFAAESRLYNQYRTETVSNGVDSRILLYFGHKIPENDSSVYHGSRPEAPFNVRLFAQGVSSFAGKDKLDLAVLSTCNNGTPAVAARLMPYTENLLASPQNLHLSHFDTIKLLLLEKFPGLSGRQLADSLAQDTFLRLRDSLQTEITLVRYNMEKIEPYISTLAGLQSEYDSSRINSPYIDCSRLPFFEESTFTRGVSIFYQPPQFGRRAGTQGHSGWGCTND